MSRAILDVPMHRAPRRSHWQTMMTPRRRTALLLGMVALAGCSGRADSGRLDIAVTGRVATADGTCIATRHSPLASQGGRVCFADRVGDPGRCVTVETHTPAANTGPPLRFPVDSSGTSAGSC